MHKSSAARNAAVGALFAVTMISSAWAGDAPAVSTLNGKAAIVGTYNNNDNQPGEFGGLFLGSATMPISHEFGFQADTALGTHDGNPVSGIGGHLFWRDPSTGLVGLTGSYLNINNNRSNPDKSVTRFGGEGEYYAGPFTLALTSGYQNGSNVADGFYGSATGYWYADDNLRLGIGATNDPQIKTAGIASIEYQPNAASMSGMTFFADASAGGRYDTTTANVGIRFYFGAGDKSLKLRNREDDPVINLPASSIDSATTTSGQTPEQACLARGGFWRWVGGQCRQPV
jgi:hypothetical protein